MYSSMLGQKFESLSAVYSTTVNLAAASRHRPIAFASEGSPDGIVRV
jgi:hypothetical protein